MQLFIFNYSNSSKYYSAEYTTQAAFWQHLEI